VDRLHYLSLGSVSTLTKQIIIFFKKWIRFLIFKIIYISITYYKCCYMNSEIIQNVAYYDDFQHDNFIFSQKFISLFWGLFNDETDLSLRSNVLSKYTEKIKFCRVL
jgi:hypothetical protein